jgi:hypothetical protein
MVSSRELPHWATFTRSTRLSAAEPGGEKEKPAGSDLPGYAAGDFEVNDFRFASWETLPVLRTHYVTLGMPTRDGGPITNAVVLLHGTTKR